MLLSMPLVHCSPPTNIIHHLDEKTLPCQHEGSEYYMPQKRHTSLSQSTNNFGQLALLVNAFSSKTLMDEGSNTDAMDVSELMSNLNIGCLVKMDEKGC